MRHRVDLVLVARVNDAKHGACLAADMDNGFEGAPLLLDSAIQHGDLLVQISMPTDHVWQRLGGVLDRDNLLQVMHKVRSKKGQTRSVSCFMNSKFIGWRNTRLNS